MQRILYTIIMISMVMNISCAGQVSYKKSKNVPQEYMDLFSIIQWDGDLDKRASWQEVKELTKHTEGLTIRSESWDDENIIKTEKWMYKGADTPIDEIVYGVPAKKIGERVRVETTRWVRATKEKQASLALTLLYTMKKKDYVVLMDTMKEIFIQRYGKKYHESYRDKAYTIYFSWLKINYGIFNPYEIMLSVSSSGIEWDTISDEKEIEIYISIIYEDAGFF